MPRQGQVNFAKGEVSPEMYARFDVQAYSSAVKRARNVRVRKYGGLAKRMGTRFVAEVLDATKPVRLLPFQFSFEQAYALEMGQGYMRPAAFGGMVLEQELLVTGVATGATTTIASAFHGFAVGDRVFLSGGDGALGDRLNNLLWRVTAVPDDGHFTIAVDTTELAFTGWSGGITRSEVPTPPEPDPVVPVPVDPPTPPVTGGGGGSGVGCVDADRALILMANFDRSGPGGARLARFVSRHEWVWTRDPATGKEQAAQIIDVSIVKEAMFSAPGYAPATEGHRYWIGSSWSLIEEFGQDDGEGYAWKAEVRDLHTFFCKPVAGGDWQLSHNIKSRDHF